MIFHVLLNMFGVLATASTNAMYPTYQYSATYSSHQKINGYSFVDVNDNFWITTFEYTANCNIYFNAPSQDPSNPNIVNYDYYLSDLIIDITVTYYQVTADDTYVLDDTANFTLNLGTLNNITNNNIDSYGYYSLEIELSDVADYTVRCPLYKQHQSLITGGIYMPRETANYFTYSFDFGFNGAFKTQLIDYINSNANNDYNIGYNSGYSTGYTTGYNDGNSTGYSSGYTTGYNDGAIQDETAVAIFSGIISVALIPINFFLACLNFEVFGINIGAFVSALLTIAIVVIITRMIMNGGNGGDK